MEGRIFILIAEKSYPVRAAHACLEEFQRQVRGVWGAPSIAVGGRDLALGFGLDRLSNL